MAGPKVSIMKRFHCSWLLHMLHTVHQAVATRFGVVRLHNIPIGCQCSLQLLSRSWHHIIMCT